MDTTFALIQLTAATLTALGGVALAYASHPNQILRRARLSPMLGWTGLAMCLLSLMLWTQALGALAGLSAALTLWMLAGVALPYVGAWRGHAAAAAPAAGEGAARDL